MGTFEVRTSERCCVVDITAQVREQINKAGIMNGICVVNTAHTTVGLAVNEAAADLFRDTLRLLDRFVPGSGNYEHPDNSDSHMKASLVGSSVVLPVIDGKPELGTWQSVLLWEFDGPRARTVRVQAVGE